LLSISASTNAVALSATGPRFANVQVMRAVAALSVVFGHALHESLRFGVPDWLRQLELWPWGIGVDLFFIISGFIMMATAGSTFGQSGAGWLFMKRRLLRIAPSYWFFTTLMLGAVLLLPTKLDTASFTPQHALLSYLFIPHFAPSGKLQPLLGLGWTLVYEMFFYLAFAFALQWRKAVGLPLLLASFVLLFIAARLEVFSAALNVFWGNSVIFAFLLGVLFWQMLKEHRIEFKFALGFILIGIGSWLLAPLADLESERLLSRSLPALALFSILFFVRPERLGRPGLWLILVGDASYALYLSHPFVIESVKQVLTYRTVNLQRFEWFGSSYAFFATVSSVLIALGFYAVVEREFTKRLVRRF